MGEVTIVMLSGAVIPYLPMIFIAFSTPAGGQQQGKRQEAGEVFQGGEGVMIGKVIMLDVLFNSNSYPEVHCMMQVTGGCPVYLCTYIYTNRGGKRGCAVR